MQTSSYPAVRFLREHIAAVCGILRLRLIHRLFGVVALVR